MTITDWLMATGGNWVFPIGAFLLALLLRIKPKKAFLSALSITTGFIGLILTVTLFSLALSPALQALNAKWELDLTIIDMGWPTVAAIGYQSLIGVLAIPISLAVNAILLKLKWTRTLTIDVWNFWHVALIGVLVYQVSTSSLLAIVAMTAYVIFLVWVADLTADDVAETFGVPGIAFPHGIAAPGILIAYPLRWLSQWLPDTSALNRYTQTIQKGLSWFGNNAIVGVLVGGGLGLIAGYKFTQALQLAVITAAVLMLLPKMTAFLMEGLTAISSTLGEHLKKYFEEETEVIGMDSALASGNTTVMAISLLLIPITFLLAIILPGVHVFPIADLATLPFMVVLIVAIFHGDFLKSLLASLLHMVGSLYLATWLAPVITNAAMQEGTVLAPDTPLTALTSGGAWPSLLFTMTAQNLGLLDLGLLLFGFLGLLFITNHNRKNGR